MKPPRLLPAALAAAAAGAVAAPYYTATELGEPNLAAASGNPLRGFLTSPDWTSPPRQREEVPSSLDFYYVGVDEIMTGPGMPDWDGSLRGAGGVPAGLRPVRQHHARHLHTELPRLRRGRGLRRQRPGEGGRFRRSHGVRLPRHPRGGGRG